MLWSTSIVSCWDGVVATAGVSSPFVSFGSNGSLFGGSVFSASVFVGGFWHFTSGITASIKLNPSDKRLIVPVNIDFFQYHYLDRIGFPIFNSPSSPILISASVYCKPFCKMVKRAAGGTSAPLMLLCEMCDSIPKVYAEWWKPTQPTRIHPLMSNNGPIYQNERKAKYVCETNLIPANSGKQESSPRRWKNSFLMVIRSIGMDFVRWIFFNRMRCRMVLLLVKFTKKTSPNWRWNGFSQGNLSRLWRWKNCTREKTQEDAITLMGWAKKKKHFDEIVFWQPATMAAILHRIPTIYKQLSMAFNWSLGSNAFSYEQMPWIYFENYSNQFFGLRGKNYAKFSHGNFIGEFICHIDYFERPQTERTLEIRWRISERWQFDDFTLFEPSQLHSVDVDFLFPLNHERCACSPQS